MWDMRVFAIGLLSVTLAATTAGIALAIGGVPGKATGGVEIRNTVTPGSVDLAFVAQGTPSDATGRVEYRRDWQGFEANTAGSVTCYLQVGNQAYFSGEFDRPFYSGPTAIPYFAATAIDGDWTGDAVDMAVVQLGADHPFACDDAGVMNSLDAMLSQWNSVVVKGNVVVHPNDD